MVPGLDAKAAAGAMNAAAATSLVMIFIIILQKIFNVIPAR